VMSEPYLGAAHNIGGFKMMWHGGGMTVELSYSMCTTSWEY